MIPCKGIKMELNKEYNCELINNGAFGKIFTLYDDLVIKIMKIDFISLTEIDIMSRLKHPNITQCLDFGLCEIEYTSEKEAKIKKVTYECNHYCIVMKKAFSDLFHFNSFDKDTLIDIIEQIKSGLAFLHNNNIIHLDLKTSNILLYGDPTKPVVKLTDFGTSVYTKDYYHMPSFSNTTIISRAPELDKSVEYNKNVDYWSLGCIIFDKVSGIQPFTGKNKEEYKNIFHSMTQKEIDDLIDKEFKEYPELIEITKKCLSLNPKERKITLFDRYPFYPPSYDNGNLVTFEEPNYGFLLRLYLNLNMEDPKEFDKDFIHILLKFILINYDIFQVFNIDDYNDCLTIVYNYIHFNDKKYHLAFNVESAFKFLTNCKGKINNRDVKLNFSKRSMDLLNKLEIDNL